MSSILKTFQICCPWFFSSSMITQYQKRLTETQQEQFMKDNIQSSNHMHHHGHQHGHQHAHIHGHHKASHTGCNHQEHHNVQNVKKKKQHHQHHQHKSQQEVEDHTEQQKIQQQSLNKQSQSTLLSDSIVENKTYTDCINPQHPYYNIIYPKLEQLPGIFNLEAQPESKVAQNEYNLKILIKQSDDDKINIFVYSFVFPTTYEFYQEIQNNYELQKILDGNIDCYECKQKLDEQTKIVYLAYKKILIVSPRDFVFVQYKFKKGHEFWNVSVSVPDAQVRLGKTRGSIIMGATRAVQRGGKLEITVYSQIDMKMPVKASAAKVRAITEIKKYLDKSYQYILKEKNNII